MFVKYSSTWFFQSFIPIWYKLIYLASLKPSVHSRPYRSEHHFLVSGLLSKSYFNMLYTFLTYLLSFACNIKILVLNYNKISHILTIQALHRQCHFGYIFWPLIIFYNIEDEPFQYMYPEQNPKLGCHNLKK